MQYSDFEVFRLNEGHFIVGEDKKFIPYQEGDPFPKGTLFVAANPFVVRHDHEVWILDTGLGQEAEGRTIAYMTEQLANLGVTREEVTKVLLSHLHADHLGGATYEVAGQRFPTFPNAMYYVQKGEMTTLPTYKSRSYELRALTLEVLEAHGQLEILEGDGWLGEHIEYQTTGGHSEYHQVFWLHSGGRSILFGGDVLPQPSQINRKFLAKYDFDPQGTAKMRRHLAMEAYERGALVLLYHSTAAPAVFIHAYHDRLGFKLEEIRL